MKEREQNTTVKHNDIAVNSERDRVSRDGSENWD